MGDGAPHVRTFLGLVAALALCITAAAPCAIAASAPDEQASQAAAPAATPDFLFGRPRGWVAIRGAWLMPRANGDLFTFVSDQLTVDKADLSSPAVSGELGLGLTSRVSASVGLEFSRHTIPSEYRRFIDNGGLSINQQTTWDTTNISGSVRVALLDRGRSISQLAFVPRAVAPYAGAGAGMLYYKFTQTGDFVDFVTFRVFPDRFDSAAWAPSAHVFGGTEVRLWRGLSLDMEGRYVWAHGTLGSDFLGFDGIDLSGFRFSTGVSLIF